jgi:hypothetical protein
MFAGFFFDLPGFLQPQYNIPVEKRVFCHSGSGRLQLSLTDNKKLEEK